MSLLEHHVLAGVRGFLLYERLDLFLQPAVDPVPEAADRLDEEGLPCGNEADRALKYAVATGSPPCHHHRTLTALRSRRRSRGVIVRSAGVPVAGVSMAISVGKAGWVGNPAVLKILIESVVNSGLSRRKQRKPWLKPPARIVTKPTGCGALPRRRDHWP